MEKVLLVKVIKDGRNRDISPEIDEMKGLINTAGGEVADVVVIKRKEISPACYIGKGRAAEIAGRYSESAELVVFDADLKPVQVRNLEKIIDKRVIDRTQLILDIFAGRAHTGEGKLQVEYAQLSYLLPRLTGYGGSMSRLTGGIGVRGPGETKLEYDRRKIKKRIQRIRKEIEKVKEIRSQQREKRKSIPVPQAALVGYTNAGKTMLLNKLTNAGMLSENRLFATLDPKIRHYILPGGYRILFSDTVGFIRDLPPHLIAAFRGTLEEVREADIILHVIDICGEGQDERKEAVRSVLKEIGAYEGKRIIEVYNKTDMATEDKKRFIYNNSNKKFYISAKTGEGIESLIKGISRVMQEELISRELFFPAKELALMSAFYDEGVVTGRRDTESGVILGVKCTEKTYEKYLKTKTGTKTEEKKCRQK